MIWTHKPMLCALTLAMPAIALATQLAAQTEDRQIATAAVSQQAFQLTTPAPMSRLILVDATVAQAVYHRDVADWLDRKQ